MARYGPRSAVFPNDYVPTALTTSAQDQATVLHVQLENTMLPASSGGTGGAAADAAARATAITESIQRRIGHQLPPELKDKLAELLANHGSDWAAPRQERGFPGVPTRHDEGA